MLFKSQVCFALKLSLMEENRGVKKAECAHLGEPAGQRALLGHSRNEPSLEIETTGKLSLGTKLWGTRNRK